MRAAPPLALLVPFVALLGCGANPTLSTPATTYLNLSGNWVALASPSLPITLPITLPSPIAEFTGALQSSGGSVAGTLRAFDPRALTQAPCVSATQDLTATGTLDANGNLVLNVPIAAGTATITATLPANLNTPVNGSWQIVGGACAMPTTAIELVHYATVTGTFTGTLNVLSISGTTVTIVPGTATPVTLVLTQSTTPNADGEFPVFGSLTATGACSGSLTAINDLVTGPGITENFSPPTNSQGLFIGTIMDPTADSLEGAFTFFSTCNSQIYQGTLTRQ